MVRYLTVQNHGIHKATLSEINKAGDRETIAQTVRKQEAQFRHEDFSPSFFQSTAGKIF